MRKLLLFVLLLMPLMPIPCTVGCGGGEESASPETIEQNRKAAMERAKRMQQEMSKKK